MKNQNTIQERAVELYNVSTERASTIVSFTKNGNIFFEHILSGNSPQGCYILRPESDSEKMENWAYLRGYLIKVVGLKYFEFDGILNATEVRERLISALNL